MPRATIPVDIDKLRKIIAEVEENGPLPTQQKLFEAVSERMSTLTHPIAPSLVRLRIIENDIPIKTEKARKVDPNKASAKDVVVPRPLKPNVKGNQNPKKIPSLPKMFVQDGFANEIEIRGNTPKAFQSIVDGIAEGNVNSLILHNCMACTGWDTNEIKHCHLKNCTFWAFRENALASAK